MDEIKVRERLQLQQRLRDLRQSDGEGAKMSDTQRLAEKKKLKLELTSIDNAERQEKAEEERRRIIREHHKREREAVEATGKTPYYLKKSELKSRTLQHKYDELKESGKLDKFLQRKKKKNTAKARMGMPEERNVRRKISEDE